MHVLFAVFAIGPLAHAATTAARGVRSADAGAVATSARTVTIYGYLSVVVAIIGMSLVQPKYQHSFGDTWVWLSLVLWAVATATVFAVLIPSLKGASTALANGAPAGSLTGRIAASGGVIALLYAVIVALMVYKPGS